MLNAYKRQNEKIMGCDMSMNVKEIRFVFKSDKNCFGTRNLNSWKILSMPFELIPFIKKKCWNEYFIFR